jgi:hypothetical protein
VNDKTISDLNAVLKYTADADILRKQLATDPEHLKPGSTLRLIAADAHEEAGDKAFADYLRSKFPLGVDNGKVKRSTLRLHRLLTTVKERHRPFRSYDGYEQEYVNRRLQDPVNEEAAKELERVGRHHEAAILRSPHPVTYQDGVVQGDYPAYAWPGGSQLIYHTQDGGTLCPECRNGRNGSEALTDDGSIDGQWNVTGVSAHDEGPPIHCDHCNKPLIATYGDPDNPEDDQ